MSQLTALISFLVLTATSSPGAGPGSFACTWRCSSGR